MNYRETGLKALEVVGGKDNVKNLTHCATRLRFEVKDRSKVQMDKLNSVPGVLKALESAGQFQFVIGPSVNECYQVVADEIGIAGGVVEDNHPEDMATAEKTEKGNLIQKALGLISGIFIPILRVTPKFCVKSNECRNRAKFICRRQRHDRLPPMSTT